MDTPTCVTCPWLSVSTMADPHPVNTRMKVLITSANACSEQNNYHHGLQPWHKLMPMISKLMKSRRITALDYHLHTRRGEEEDKRWLRCYHMHKLCITQLCPEWSAMCPGTSENSTLHNTLGILMYKLFWISCGKVYNLRVRIGALWQVMMHCSPHPSLPALYITLYNEKNHQRKISELFTVLSYTLRWSDYVCN